MITHWRVARSHARPCWLPLFNITIKCNESQVIPLLIIGNHPSASLIYKKRMLGTFDQQLLITYVLLLYIHVRISTQAILVNLDSSGSIQVCSNNLDWTSNLVFKLSKDLGMVLFHFDWNKSMGTFQCNDSRSFAF